MDGESGEDETAELTWRSDNQEETYEVVADEKSQEVGFQKRGDACQKERSVIFRVEWVDGRARVTADEERVLWDSWREIKS